MHLSLRTLWLRGTETTSSTITRWRLAVMVALVCLGVGCGSSGKGAMGTVSGKVTLQEQALTSGYIALTSPTKGHAAGTKLDSKGTFTLPEPLPAGEYVVTVIPPPAEGSPLSAPPGPQPPKSDIPQKYRTEAKTDLKFTVKAGANTANFDLKP